MTRPLRIEFENAFYHVMNRGAGKRNIFNNLLHKKIYLELLEEVNKLFEIEIHAYCLMNNHYHLLIQTPRANLSRAMRHINGVYTQKFNKNEKLDGPLFRGRYKSILVSFNEYFLNVSRYIHLNPVTAKIVTSPENFSSSSFLYFMQPDKKPKWLNTEKTLSFFNASDPSKAYNEFVNKGIDKETYNFYIQNKTPAIFGSSNFRDNFLNQLNEGEINASKSDYRRIKKIISFDQIINSCSQFFNANRQDILISKRGITNLPRKIAVHGCRMIICATLAEIAQIFGFRSHSTISEIIKEIELCIERDWEFSRLIKRLHSIILNTM